MKEYEKKIRDLDPHEPEEKKHYGRAIFWAAFALIVSFLAVMTKLEGETVWVPLLVGVAALGLIFAMCGLKDGDE